MDIDKKLKQIINECEDDNWYLQGDEEVCQTVMDKDRLLEKIKKFIETYYKLKNK